MPQEPRTIEPPGVRRARNRLRVVCLGGGTGLSMILRGLKRIASVTAVVTTTDDGGSSGRLRRDFGMPAPGDVRHCLSALAEDESLVGQLFEHRFATGELAGHSFGNLFLAGLTDLLGSFDQAVSESARVLAVAGRVVPSTTDMVELVAEFDDGSTVRGETAIAALGRPVRTVRLDPPDPRAHPRALQAIERADLIVMGPGSLFTSTLPPLLVPGIREAVRMARVPRVYVCNLLQQPGETIGYRASDHVPADLRPRGQRPGGRRAGQPQPCRARRTGGGRPGRAAQAGGAGIGRPAGHRMAARLRPAGPLADADRPRRARGVTCRSPRLSATSWSSAPRRKACCRSAFLSGLIRGAGALQVRGAGEIAVVAEIGPRRRQPGWPSSCCASGAPTATSSPTVSAGSTAAISSQLRIHGDRSLQLLHEIGLLTSALGPPRTSPSGCSPGACCRGAYLRGALRRRRARSRRPGRPAHLEIRAPDIEHAAALCEIAARDGPGASGGAARRGHAIAYAKRRETVHDLLVSMGVQDAVLSFDEAEVVSRTRGAGEPADQLRPGEPGARLGAPPIASARRSPSST